MFPHQPHDPLVFDEAALARMPIGDGSRGEIEMVEEPPRRRLYFVPREDGQITRWNQPEQGHTYVIGAYYVSLDWSVGLVADYRTGVQVAQIRGRLAPPAFAHQLAIAGKLYNNAFLVPASSEREFIEAIPSGYPSELIYKRGQDFPHQRGQPGGSIGFEMNTSTRPRLVQILRSAFLGHQRPLLIRSPIARQECIEFSVAPDGTWGMAGVSAACVWAAALAAHGLEVAPDPHAAEQRPKRERPRFE